MIVARSANDAEQAPARSGITGRWLATTLLQKERVARVAAARQQ